MKWLTRPAAQSGGTVTTRLGLGASLLLSAWTLAPSQVGAQEQDDPAVIATARELAISGVKLAQDGRCGDALPKLERAEKLHHSPIVQTRLGACYIQLGQLLAGLEELRAVLREPPPDTPSEAMQQAYAEAAELVEANKPKLAKLTIKVTGVADPEAANLSLTIDDKPMPAALLGGAHLSDPGEHKVAITAPGSRTTERTLTLAPGSEQSIEMALEPDPEAMVMARSQALHQPAVLAPGEGTAPDAATAVDAGPSASSHLPAYLTWGASAAALGVGVGFGISALENKRTLQERCPDKLCPPEQADLLNTSRTNATISTLAYSVGVAGLAVGALLFWLESRDAADSGSVPAQRARLRLRPRGVALEF